MKGANSWRIGPNELIRGKTRDILLALFEKCRRGVELKEIELGLVMRCGSVLLRVSILACDCMVGSFGMGVAMTKYFVSGVMWTLENERRRGSRRCGRSFYKSVECSVELSRRGGGWHDELYCVHGVLIRSRMDTSLVALVRSHCWMRSLETDAGGVRGETVGIGCRRGRF